MTINLQSLVTSLQADIAARRATGRDVSEQLAALIVAGSVDELDAAVSLNIDVAAAIAELEALIPQRLATGNGISDLLRILIDAQFVDLVDDGVGGAGHAAVTLAGTPDYITISGQVITRNAVDLTTDVVGDLPVAEGGTGASTAADARTNLGAAASVDNSEDVTLAGTPDYITISGQVITRNAVDLAADVSGNLPVANLNSGTAASGTTFWRGDGTWAEPAGVGSIPISSISDIALDGPQNNDLMAYDTASGKWKDQTAKEAGVQADLSPNATVTPRATGNISFAGGSDGQVLTVQADGSVAFEDASAHQHDLVDIVDAGLLAALDTVATDDIDDDAVTGAKMADTTVTPGQYTFGTGSITFDQQGRATDAVSGGAGGGLATVDDANTTILIGDANNATHRRLTAATAITLTLDAQGTVGTKVAVTPKGVGVVTTQVEAGAEYKLPLDTAGRTASFIVSGYVFFEVVANSDGDSAEWDVVGETNHDDTIDNDVDLDGFDLLNIGDGSTFEDAAATLAALGGLPTTGVGLVEQISGHIETAADKTYVLDLKAPYAYTINSLAAKTASGTCTAKLTIDGVDVTGITALAVSSTEDFDDATAANAVSAGNTVALVISSNSAALDLQFTVKITR